MNTLWDIFFPRFIRYLHHGAQVWTRSDLKGTYRQACLCYRCLNFAPGQPYNCSIAQKLFELDKEHHLVTPVYECPKFMQGKPL